MLFGIVRVLSLHIDTTLSCEHLERISSDLPLLKTVVPPLNKEKSGVVKATIHAVLACAILMRQASSSCCVRLLQHSMVKSVRISLAYCSMNFISLMYTLHV